jgi:hypothetical protein
MRRVSRLVIAALFLQFFVGGVNAEAAPAPIRISTIEVNGALATVKWNSVKLAPKEFFEVEIAKPSTSKTYKVIKTKSNTIVAKLDPFTEHTIRVRKTSAPNNWTLPRTIKTTSEPVSGVSVSNQTHTSAEVSWLPVAGATGYEVFLDKTLLTSVVATKYSLLNLKPGFLGKINIRAIAGTVKGASSSMIEINTLNSGPDKLTSSLVTSTGFTLGWNAVAGATSYNVYSEDVLLGSSNSTSISVAKLMPGSSANYSVRAVFGTLETLPSEKLPVATLVEKPSKPVVSAITATTVTTSWTLDPNADSYSVSVYDSLGTTAVKTLTVDRSLNSAVFTGLSATTAYTAGIVINYAKVSSKLSDLATFTTSKPVMTGVAVTNITTTTVTLSWTPLSMASSYEVFRDGVAVATAITTSVASYVFTSLAPGQTYKLGVRAVYFDGVKGTSYTDITEISSTSAIDAAFRPTISTAPVISLPYANSPVIGATITVNTGTWTSVPSVSSYAYQWQRSLNGGSTWNDLLGATTASYLVTVSDNTYRLRARVSATNVNGTTATFTTESLPVASVYNIQVPIVRGEAVLGQVLEVSDGSWSSPYPVTLSYKWRRGADVISGATSPSYTLTTDDVGFYISGEVTALTSHGALTILSPNRGFITAVGNTVLPVISGTLRVGGTVSVSSGTWLNLASDSTASYQWQSSSDGVLWNNISGATSASYVLKLSQAGLFIRAQVFQTKSTFTAVIATSLSTAAVPALNLTNTVSPAVTGAWTVGTSISASTGTWSTSGTYTYQWQSSSDNSTWTDIASATSGSYTLTSSEASKYVRVQVINTSSAGAGIAYSVARSKVGAPFNTAIPAITGTIKVGSTQTVSTGTWSNTPTSYAYQWQKSSDGISWINLSGETANTYVPTFDVANLRIRVSVGAGNAVETATVTTAIISGFLPPQATAIPAITGTKTVGQTLTSSAGTWPGTSDSYVYQWQRSSDNGVTWTDISAATASTYVLVAADAGYQIRSQVSLTVNAGSSSAYSLPTVGIAP